MKLSLRFFCLFAAFIGFFVSSTLIYGLIKHYQDNQALIYHTIKQSTQDAAKDIGARMSSLMAKVHDFESQASRLKDKTPDKSLGLLRQNFEENTDLFAMNITYEPYYMGPDTKYFSPYFERLTGDVRYFDLKGYDEIRSEFAWYHLTMEQGPIWTEPYFALSNGILMTTYSIPFYENMQDRRKRIDPIGVVSTDVGLNYLTERLKLLDANSNGYGMIFSGDRKLISHPVSEWVRQGYDLDFLIERYDESQYQRLRDCFTEPSLQLVQLGKESLVETDYYAACVQVPNTDWTMITIFTDEQMSTDVNSLRKDFILALTAVVFTLYLLLIGLSQAYLVKLLNWRFTLCAALLFSVGTASIWWLANTYYSSDIERADSIVNVAEREAFVESYVEESKRLRYESPTFIPTGLHVEAIEFRSANNVFVSGYTWQRHNNSESLIDIEPVIFPESISSTVEEAYRENLGDETTIGWYFEVELRQPFDYSKYPFDSKNLWIRIWPAEFYHNHILVPDLEAYDQLTPAFNPAVESNVVLNEWNLKRSSFKYIGHDYKSNFGMRDKYQGQHSFPEMYYNIELERQFLSPFITTLLPVLVISALLFAATLGMKKSNLVEYRNNTAALIFSILLAHYSIRERLAIADVVYFEFFYFLLYLVIAVLLIIGHRFYQVERSLFTYKDNKVTSMWYWPIFLGAIFVMTAVTYY